MRFGYVVSLGLLAVGLATFWVMSTCTRPAERDTRLLTMAAEEANLISDHRERLMRQLNIADWQVHTHRKPDGQRTLLKAVETLQDENNRKDLDEFGRISGWASIAELARAADDNALSLKACDEALETLQSLNPPARRCEYVLSLATQVQILRGTTEATRLLSKAGGWAETILDKFERRQALLAFSNRLFDLKEWSEGQTMLRHDADAAWRSDTLAAMANIGHTPAGIASWGKNVDYESTYRNADLQKNLRQQKD